MYDYLPTNRARRLTQKIEEATTRGETLVKEIAEAEEERERRLDEHKLACAKADALVMHPGPMNRGIEIDSGVADGVQSVIHEQVEMGVAVRMAVLDALARNLPGGGNG